MKLDRAKSLYFQQFIRALLSDKKQNLEDKYFSNLLN